MRVRLNNSGPGSQPEELLVGTDEGCVLVAENRFPNFCPRVVVDRNLWLGSSVRRPDTCS